MDEAEQEQPARMIPAGYMAKRVYKKDDWLKVRKKTVLFETAPQIVDIYSVSNCLSEDFADYISSWKHNGYWLFDSPEVIRDVARQNSIQLEGTALFYYEVYSMEFDGERWTAWSPELSFPTNVVPSTRKRLEGFDAVTFYARTNPECSPLSCNSMAGELHTNAHCLFESFEDAEKSIRKGAFKNAEPGPYRIFAVYSVEWP
jgi:hypothetical protein